MAKIAAAKTNFSVNAVAIEDEANSIDLSIDQEVITVDGFSQAGPERVVGNYSWSENVAGNFDGAASQGDATFFALLGSAGVATDYDPTGTTAGASNPHYTGTVVMKSLKISSKVGAAVTYTVDLEGASALVRAVA